MSNSYFQFKQFRVEQAPCAMKVSTDACIQGAWTPILARVNHILDVGSGTGLLSLMLAQRNNRVQIDAIELEEQAAQQAAENFDASPWSDRLRCIYGDARTYPFDKKYDLIICNPPFFAKSLLGEDDKRNQARHELHFSLEDLLVLMGRYLSEEGYSSVLLPVTEQGRWTKLLQDERYASSMLKIHPSVSRQANRTVTLSSKKRIAVEEDTVAIRSKDNDYSEAFVSLMQPFYLHL